MAPPTRTRRRDDARVRRALIIDAAIKIIGQLGFHGFTIQDLAARCELSNAGLLYHFPSKERLFDAVVEELEQREILVMTPLVAAVENAQVPRERLAALVQLLHAMATRGGDSLELVRFYAVLQAESLDKAHPAHDSFRKREYAVLDLFTRLLAPHVKEPLSAARQLLALIDGLRLQWLRSNQRFDAVAEWIEGAILLVPALAPLRHKHARDSKKPGAAKRRPRTGASHDRSVSDAS